MNYQYQEIASHLIELSKKDLLLREELAKSEAFYKGYHPEMEELHKRNAEELEKIIYEIGWPTAQKVGSRAAYAAWLILQHAISKPDLQRRSLSFLQEMANNNEIAPYEVAALYDRICYFEMRPQKYGTQFDFDEKNCLCPWVIEDTDNVDKYREEVGLPPLNDMIIRMRKIANDSNEKPYAPYDVRLKERIEWAKKVGWIK